MQSGKFGWIFNDFHEQKLKMWMLIPTHLDNHDYNTAKMRRTPWSISFRQVPRVVPCISRPKGSTEEVLDTMPAPALRKVLGWSGEFNVLSLEHGPQVSALPQHMISTAAVLYRSPVKLDLYCVALLCSFVKNQGFLKENPWTVAVHPFGKRQVWMVKPC